MKLFSLWGFAIVAALCGSTGVTFAQDSDVVANLEIPAQDQTVGGIGLLSGWAFVQGGEDVRVQLRIDGVTQDTRLACCTARADVDAEVPGAPDNTGFGMLVNFSELTPGPHLIGVDARSTDAFDDFFGDRERKVIDHNVIVVRPGNTATIDTLNLNGATCSIVNNEVVLQNVQVSSSQGTSATNLSLGFLPNSQTFGVNDSSDAPQITAFAAHLNGSQEVPLVKTSATGEATLTLNTDNSVACNVTTKDLSGAVAAHIHPGAAGVEGTILIPLNGGPTVWTCPAGAVLTTAQVTALRAGQMYFNVHTSANPDGEIRGQIVAPGLTSQSVP